MNKTVFYKSVRKFITNVLRHEPEKLSLFIDKEGWVYMDDLVSAMSLYGFQISINNLRELVGNDEKGRFEIDSTDTRIRATYGHSISVTIHHLLQEPPAVLYLSTNKKRAEKILAEGLQSDKGVCLYIDYDKALQIACDYWEPQVLLVDAKGLYQEGVTFYLGQCGTWIADRVIPSCLKLMEFSPFNINQQDFQILVDADSSPVIGEIEKIAKFYRIKVVLLHDYTHEFKSKYSQNYIVGQGKNAADLVLVNLCRPGDIVISDDRGLRDMALARQAYVMDTYGEQYGNKTTSEIIQLISSREKKHREFSYKRKKRTSKINDNFTKALEKLIKKIL